MFHPVWDHALLASRPSLPSCKEYLSEVNIRVQKCASNKAFLLFMMPSIQHLLLYSLKLQPRCLWDIWSCGSGKIKGSVKAFAIWCVAYNSQLSPISKSFRSSIIVWHCTVARSSQLLFLSLVLTMGLKILKQTEQQSQQLALSIRQAISITLRYVTIIGDIESYRNTQSRNTKHKDYVFIIYLKVITMLQVHI